MPVLAPLWQFYCPPTPVCFPSCVTCAAIFCMACASSAGEWILKFVPSSARGSAGSPRVLHNLYDHTSILKLLEWRWKLPTLTTRDASDQITNLKHALDFGGPQLDVPALPAPATYVPLACPNGSGQTFGDTVGQQESIDMSNLQQLAVSYGWPIY